MDPFTERMLERAMLRREKLKDHMSKERKPNRLAELATKINGWEDDVDHPRKNFTSSSKPAPPVPKEAAIKTQPNPEPSRKEILKNVENQENNRPMPKSPAKKLSISNVTSPKMGLAALKDSAVLKKAALYESNIKSPSKAAKDPSELSLSERRALFEKNKEAKPPKIFKAEVKGRNLDNIINTITENKIEKSASQKEIGFRNSPEPLKIVKEVKKIDVSPAKIQKINPPKLFNAEEKGKNMDKVLSTIPEIKIEKSASQTEIGFRDSPETLKIIKEVKKIDVSPARIPKTGRLYPSLSDIETVEESEGNTSSDTDSLNASKSSNIYLNMSLGEIIEANRKNPLTPPSNYSECQVLNDMDNLLDEALGDISSSDEDSPTPPKMLKSTSFEYKSNPEGGSSNQLIHTVSFYRKQQQTPLSTPVKVVKREDNMPEMRETDLDESPLVEEKIQYLLQEINTQQTQISQASQALNLCLSTVEFSESKEQIEFERVLLLASHKRQACLNEVQRLKIENTLRPKGSVSDLTENGDVTIKEIKIPLKREAIHSMAAVESMHYFVCLVKCDEQVLATSAVPATNLVNLTLPIPGEIKLANLCSDFKITVEIYNLELSKEMLPHDIKYHIANKKKKKLLTPIKNKRTESKLIMPCIQSPAGPNAVRTSNFQMCGYFVFSLREISRQQWTLNKVPYTSPLEGSISLKIETQLRFDSVFTGFLTMFDDISGFGAWHRRWCRLASEKLSYWKYPDDENTKIPIGTIDLRAVITENVGIVSRDICARLHTFLLETTRPRQDNDKESLVLNIQGETTRIRHLLSADSKEEMLEWCKKLNRILALLRSWGCSPTS